MIERERSDGSYRMSAYFVSKVVTEIPLQLIATVVFVSISYWMSGARMEAGPFFLFLVLTCAGNLAASGAGLVISAVTRDMRVATVSSLVMVYLWCVPYLAAH